ncbi:Uncharacterised protein g1884 [Pycnogonum litorale]
MNDKQDFPGKLLHQAALWGNAELLEDLLNGEQIELIDSVDGFGRTALHAAATNESETCLRILLQAGANPNISASIKGFCKTPLHIASQHGYVKTIELLLECKSDLFAKDSNGQTALDIADQAGHVQVMELLKKAAAELEMIKHELHIGLREACSRGDVNAARHMIKELETEAELILNSAPNGSNTLLFKACEEDQREIVKLLIEHGADERIHPVTKYSPLYIAAYYGRKEICEILLQKFPQMVQVVTVEKWLPIHAATINGHIDVLELLLKYPDYPPCLMSTFKDKTQTWQYSMPFDTNAKDVTGQTALYLACYLGNLKLVDVLLRFRVKADRINASANEACVAKKSNSETSPKKRISDSLSSIMARLSMGRNHSDVNQNKNEIGLSPLDLDVYCNNNKETALHTAVKNKRTTIVSLLLSSGANPNLILHDVGVDNLNDDDSFSSNTSTALAEACKNRDLGVVDMLLKNGAADDDGRALAIAVKAKDEIIISKLLTLKSFSDPDYKINRKSMNICTSNQFAGTNLFTYSSMFPTTAVMINWHNMKCLESLREKWLIDACVHHNPKLKLNIKNQFIAMGALTRLDLSNNMLRELPLCIFQMPSLRTLNVAQNKIDCLPVCETSSLNSHGRKKFAEPTHKFNINHQNAWFCPALEEILLQDNRLEAVPEVMFDLPSLMTLDVSNNKLHSLPYRMWSAPKLRELNVALNMLSQLPLSCSDISSASQSPISSKESSAEFEVDIGSSAESLKSKKQSSLSAESPSAIQENMCKDDNLSTDNINLVENDLTHHNLWSNIVNVIDVTLSSSDGQDTKSCLLMLNLSHNSFKTIPPGLSCFATNLSRLNMSYNQLTDMSSVGSYPPSVKQLDLSNNQIKSWMSLRRGDPDLTGLVTETGVGYVTCYNPKDLSKQILLSPVHSAPGRKWSQRSASSSVSGMAHSPQPVTCCAHRRHSRLENLRTLILSNNQLENFELFARDDEFSCSEEYGSQDSLDIGAGKETGQIRSKLIFPNVSMLDLSCNNVKEIATSVPELTNLSVLNISKNHISYLPPEMGLLGKLWNLNTRGCPLDEPLKSMIESKKYKTMDIIGYLKSILEDAKPYARMKLMIVGIQGIGKTSLLDQLRHEGTGTFKRKPPEHWAKRMGNRNINLKTAKGVSISTVGVDVGDWTYEKKVRGNSNHGPVVFSTWDFGGQREYYATHQYFLSKRSLYLVVWKITDGEKGVNEILHWLVNIQARAPNAPVLIIGTHYDLVKENFPPAFSEDLQQLIRERFINVVDADKCGLPRVLDTIEVSCKTRHNVKLLCNLIYDTVFELRSPGSKERLLEQKIPATYLALEDVIGNVATTRKLQGKDPVLRSEQYKMMVMLEIQEKYGITFRDAAELNQATTFLHENGVLLHYEDATLKNLYFLDPQWLCDMLAHVVTIREINPFAKNGIMKIDDLKHVFKTSNCAPIDAKAYILSLLNKFEVALTWDNRTLLIPSLLPTEAQLRLGLPGCDVRIPVRSRCWISRNKQFAGGNKNLASGSGSSSDAYDLKSSQSVVGPPTGLNVNEPEIGSSSITHHSCPQKSIHRLLLMSYYPSGFWSRLITRMLADDSVVEVIRSYFEFPKEDSSYLMSLFSYKAEWVCWQTGLELRYMDTTLFRIKELLPESYLYLGPNTRCDAPYDSYDYRHMRFLLQLEGTWMDLNVSNSAILEIYLPCQTAIVPAPSTDRQPIILYPNRECVAKLLSSAVDHIDTLLEDWYPTLGTRFVHTSEGKFLVTRLVPCSKCLMQQYRSPEPSLGTSPWDRESWQLVDQSGFIGHLTTSGVVPGVAIRQHVSDNDYGSNAQRQSHDSAASHDSGVGRDSNSSSRKPSVEGPSDGDLHEQSDTIGNVTSPTIDTPVYSFMVEECILKAYEGKTINCPLHGEVLLSDLTPDTVFSDLGERCIIRPDAVKRGKMLGRGAFGFVFKASIKQRVVNTYLDVALKMLQPVDPGFGARQSAAAAYKAAWSKWQRDPIQYACKAYCTARQELNILLTLRHPHIVPFVGMCLKPLALVLRLASQGALDVILKNYRRSGAKLEVTVIQKIVLQVAKAIEYLHQQHIIYRDLKSENVLVWALPAPFQCIGIVPVVDVKLADYGISRTTLPTGTKGFGGTEGFMAPEILKYNGEEEYTEKVDCFSFGMFMYELVTLRQPFEGTECVKDQVLEGGRPNLTQRETIYPLYILDLMTLCWSQQPQDRPSASQIVSISSAPEFVHLIDTVSLNDQMAVLSTDLVTFDSDDDAANSSMLSEMWLSRLGKQLDILTCTKHGWQQYKTLTVDDVSITSMVVVGDQIWLGTSRGAIRIYNSSNCNQVSSFALDPDSPCETISGAAIRAMCHLPVLDRVAVASSSGRLWHCGKSTEDETLNRIVELGSNGNPIYAMASIVKDPSGICELWCGQSQGGVSIFNLKTEISGRIIVTSQEVIHHYESSIDNIEVLQIVSSKYDNKYVWSYVYPGCVVYHWDASTRTIINKLDCSKLVPCSESIMSISIEEHLSPGRCQVTAMAILGTSELYIGTTWGCIIVAEGSTMRPVTVFRPFEEEVKAILPICYVRPTESSPKTEHNVVAEKTIRNLPMIITVGRGYRSLLSRYTTLPLNSIGHSVVDHRSTYAFLWRSDSWLNV